MAHGSPLGKGPRVSLTLKLSLAGDPGVGKTSLIRRFVSNTFDEKYVTTLGVKVSSRSFSIDDPQGQGPGYDVVGTIWDIMGSPGFREVLKEAYFRDIQGLLLVCDGTRPETFHSLTAWFNAVRSVARGVPVVVLLNKADLTEALRVSPGEVEAFCAPRGWKWFPTSAKTGQNVEGAFMVLAESYVRMSRGAPATLTMA